MIGREAISKLLPDRAGPCISLYIPGGEANDGKQQATRFYNLLRCVENDLQFQEVGEIDFDSLLGDLHPSKVEAPFWKSPTSSIAAFFAPNFSWIAHLPIPVAMQYRMASRFHILPLLPLLDPFKRFFILSLNQDEARFFEATCDSIQEVPLFASEMGKEEPRVTSSPKAGSLLTRQPNGGVVSSARARASVLDQRPVDLIDNLRMINSVLHKRLSGERAPLLLAAFGFVASLYEGINSYRNLLPMRISGSFAHRSIENLHSQALELVSPVLERDREQALNQFEGMELSNTTIDLLETLVAAEEGRARTVFLAERSACDGYFDPVRRALTIDPLGENLLELIAARALQNGGEVSVLSRDEMPGRHSVATILSGDRCRSVRNPTMQYR